MTNRLYEITNIGNGKRIGAIFQSIKKIDYRVSDIYDERSKNDTVNRFIIETNRFKIEGYFPVIAYSNIDENTVKKIRKFVNPNQEKRNTILTEKDINDLTDRLTS